jgi:hypothetical protein
MVQSPSQWFVGMQFMRDKKKLPGNKLFFFWTLYYFNAS